ncbi:probable tyrosyl-DNA phosphodiesterase [Copidosoma floridanum]|uniref:probable tyrosyl-DNA phosphodiesterase n=1 Tax=Copidosoma floridanum TaxID=29053 RepID=UPI0006C9BC9B|nr:probable tyrosyl-DNA phosphodiesterase [Copidosoma floridanum]
MNSILKDGIVGEKKICPYKEKCYRKNPVHFNEMSHPHLEKLIIDQLDATISIPENLSFECSNRSQLLDQLKVLQVVLKKERDRNQKNDPAETSQEKPSENRNPSNEDKELKEKIKRHKQAALETRIARLKEMDAKAVYPKDDSEGATSKKRFLANTSSSASPKKAKNQRESQGTSSGYSSVSDADSQSTSSQCSTDNSSSNEPIIETYMSSTDRTRRERVREDAIARMRLAGHKVDLVHPGDFALKYALSAPYHYFLNRVEKSQVTHDQQFTVSFPELLDVSLGEIVNSLHINFMVEIGWLCLQYLLAAQNAKMTIFCGQVCDALDKYPENIRVEIIQMPGPYGIHHSKVSLFQYSDGGIRIVVSTANIYSDDWENRTQCVWMSPHLPRLPDSANPSDGESPTNFKKHFREYLVAYKNAKMVEWENIVKKADFSSVNVFFVASVPGSHKGSSLNMWGHRKLGYILSEHAILPPDAPQWTIIAQCSSIGNLGPNFNSWIQPNIVSSMVREKAKGLKSDPNFHFVYPTLRNYEESFDCRKGTCCLPYSRKSHEKQQWIKNHMYQWKADETGRTRAMPHSKCYTRLSPDQTEIPWFVLTSANLSKAAWGSTAKTGNSFYIMNYEAGVVFIPKFITKQTTFPIKNSSSPDVPVFRLPYDLPLTRYGSNDEPFVVEFMSD